MRHSRSCHTRLVALLRSVPPATAALGFLAISLTSLPARAEVARLSLALEAGSEYDSNVHRIEEDPAAEDRTITGAPLARLAWRGRLQLQPSSRDRLGFAGLLAAKLIGTAEAQEETLFVASGEARYDRRIPSRSALLSVRGSYYDASSAPLVTDTGTTYASRTFALGGADVGLTIAGPGSHVVALTAGLRRFRYDPDADFDWTGEGYDLRYATTAWKDDALEPAAVDVAASYRLEHRRFASSALTRGCAEDVAPDPRCFVPTDLPRADLNHRAAAEVVYTAKRIYSGRLELEVNDSSSVGQSLARQRLELGVTSALAGGVYLTARATVQVNIFLDPLLLARDINNQTFTAIDDENRNSLILQLARDLFGGWTAEARYALFTNELATQERRFRRQMVYLGVLYAYDSQQDSQ